MRPRRRSLVAFAALAALAIARPAAAAPAERPWLGVALEAAPGVGVRVTEVIPGTPAEHVGLVRGDVIAAIDGRPLRTPEQLIADVARRAVGDAVALTVRRRDRARDLALRATLAARLDAGEILAARLVDRAAPGFALPVAAGPGGGKLAGLAGKVVVLEFLATWCRPCKSTYRALDQLDGDPDVVVLGIASEPPAELAALARAERIGFALLHDAGETVRRAYSAGATPTLVVIDRRGVVRHAGIGAGAELDLAIFAARRAVADRAR